MKNDDLISRIFEDERMKFASADFPDEVKEYMKIKIPEFIDNYRYQ